MTDFEKLFFPRAVGIIGVNDKPYGGGYFLRCLKSIQFDKPLYIFNPRLEGIELDGIQVKASISEISDPIDYVILAVPADKCISILKEVGEKKVPFVTIFTSGFSEIGRQNLEIELLKIACKYNIRIIGPNCLGIYNPKSRLSVSRWHTTNEGHLGIISQSGGLSIYMSNMAIYIYYTYISKLISIGNQIDLNVVDFLKYFLTDNDTKVIGLYLENIKNQETGKEFIKIVKELSIAKKKPVILWKVGWGPSSREAIFSHTGGMAGSTRIWQAISKQTGAILVQDSFELISLAMAFEYLDFRQVNRNLGIVAIGGGSSIELTEQMEIYNLIVPKLHAQTLEKFKRILPDVNTIIRNPLDLGGSGFIPKIFSECLITLDSDPNISIVIFVKPYYFNKEFIDCVLNAKSKMKKPLVCIAHKVMDDIDEYKEKLEFKKALFEARIPIFESIELTAKALDRMCTYKELLDKRNKL
ncbi:MAG: CoA-binding protein [Candidatus Hermodarchaeota archaeon]